MEMPKIEADHKPLRERIAQIKLVRSDHIALASYAEQLAFDRVLQYFTWKFSGVNSIERFEQPTSGSHSISGNFLASIRDPEIVYARAAKLAAHESAYFSRSPAVLDPEISDTFVLMAQCKAIVSFRMGEQSSVEVQPQPLRPGPL